jgi:hypothetical protein
MMRAPRREPLLFAQQAEQDVLGADVVVAQPPRLFLSQDDDVAGALCKSLEQTPEDRSSPERLQASAKTVDVQALGAMLRMRPLGLLSHVRAELRASLTPRLHHVRDVGQKRPNVRADRCRVRVHCHIARRDVELAEHSNSASRLEDPLRAHVEQRLGRVAVGEVRTNSDPGVWGRTEQELALRVLDTEFGDPRGD